MRPAAKPPRFDAFSKLRQVSQLEPQVLDHGRMRVAL